MPSSISTLRRLGCGLFAETANLSALIAVNQSLDTYGAHHLMGSITGNQDRPRFTSLADGALIRRKTPNLLDGPEIEHHGNVGTGR